MAEDSTEATIPQAEKIDKTSKQQEVMASMDGKLKAVVSDEDIRREKRRIMKNVFLISVAFLFNFNAFQGLSRLQSTLHQEEGLGVITSSIIYGTLMLSCMFLPKLLIQFVGHKWTITVSFSGYILYMAANGYAVWGTMVTASILVGLCAAPLWTAQCSYFTVIGQRYARLTGDNQDATVSRFFGIFFMFFQASSITGSVISSTVLKGNAVSMEDVDVSSCGASNCPWSNISNGNLDPPPMHTVWTMLGIYIGIACMAVVLVAVFVDRLPKEDVPRTDLKKEIANNLVATFRHLRHKKQLLIIPLTMYSGFEQTSFNAELSQAFVGCSLGIWKIGLVTLPYGFFNAAMCIASGHMIKYTGRLPIFIFGMCCDLCIQITLMTWHPSPQQEYVLYILAAMWGLTDGIWQTQINTLYSLMFGTESEAAFSNYRMWESLGFIIAFAYSFYLCTSVKLYILTSMLIIGMLGYFAVEYVHWKERKVSTEEKDSVQSEQTNCGPVETVFPDGHQYNANGSGGTKRLSWTSDTLKPSFLPTTNSVHPAAGDASNDVKGTA